jgi:hypothetical protein
MTMQACDRSGVFRIEIIEYGLKEMDSGSIAVAVRARLTQWWDGAQWVDWAQYDMECSGDVWIVKKDGSTNDKAAESLMRHAGWDASLPAITEGTWKPSPCQAVVNQEEYKGTKSYKIAFLNDFERTPGAMSNVDTGKAKELENRFGSTLRGLHGNIKRNASAPTASRPPAPPPAAPQSVAAGANGDGIPF